MTTPEQTEFLRVLNEFESLRTSWNQMTPEARTSAKDHFTVNNRDVAKAAKAFAKAAADRHRIEEVAKVYLALGSNGWELDRPEDPDPHPLDGYENGAGNDACYDDHNVDLNEECNALKAAANYISLPSMSALRHMFTELEGTN